MILWHCPNCYGSGSNCDGSMSFPPNPKFDRPATTCRTCQGMRYVTVKPATKEQLDAIKGVSAKEK